MGIVTQPRTDKRRRLSVDDFTAATAQGIRQKIQSLKLRSQERAETSEQYLYACATTAAAIKYYWHQIQSTYAKPWALPVLGLDEPLPGLNPETAEIANALGATVAGLDAINAAYFLGELYTALLPESLRAKYGIFFTPPALTTRLIDLATQAGTDWANAHVLDPACGGGAFLTPVALRMIDALGIDSAAETLAHITTHLRGFELDPFSGWMSQVLLEAALIALCRTTGRRLPRIVVIGDALTMRVEGREVDLVIGNPPYGRLTLSPELRTKYRRSLYGHANAYGIFMEVAVRWTSPGGIIAYITPTGFLGGQYFKHLRALMVQEAPPVEIDLVTSRRRVFSDVLQETLLGAYKRGGNSQRAKTNILELLTETTYQLNSTGDFRVPSHTTDPWLIPRSRHHSSLIARLHTMPHRLADYGYKVSTGPLVWNRHKTQLLDEAVAGSYPIIWSECVTPDGSFQYRTRKRNHKGHIELLSNQDWLLTRTPCVLVQRTTAKEQRRRLIAAELPDQFIRRHGAVSIENHLNMIRPAIEQPKVSLRSVAALFNSQVVDSAFRCISGSVAVSATELESLPLPAPDKLGQLDRLLDRRDLSAESIERYIAELYLQDE